MKELYKQTYKPLRGRLENLQKNIKERANELVYLTDINKLGIINSWGFPQLLVDIVDCKDEFEFPNIKTITLKEKGKLYYNIKENITYYFDSTSDSFEPISIVLKSGSYNLSLKTDKHNNENKVEYVDFNVAKIHMNKGNRAEFENETYYIMNGELHCKEINDTVALKLRAIESNEWILL